MSGSCCSIPDAGADSAGHPARGEGVPAHGPTVNLLGPAPADLAECVVMPGSTVVKADAEAAGLYRDVDGTRYWFCCAGCAPRFDADPAAYIAA